MINNNLDLKDIDIKSLFNQINYIFYGNDGKIIKWGNGYFEIHFYIKTKTYYSEDKRDIIKLVVDYCMNNFNKLMEAK